MSEPIQCCGKANRKRGGVRQCGQRAIYEHDGKFYCWYHHPEKPRAFGERATREDFQMARIEKDVPK